MRRLRVSVNNEKVFDGEVEKGCGNQVFDYHKTIRVHDNTSVTSDSSSADSASGAKRKQDIQPLKNSTTNSRTAVPLQKGSHKSVNDVILPPELLNQPSEYDSTRKNGAKSTSAGALTPSSSSSSLSQKHSKSRSERSASRSRRDSSRTKNDSESSPEHVSSRLTPRRMTSADSQEAFEAPTGTFCASLTIFRVNARCVHELELLFLDSLSTPRQRHRQKKSRMSSKLDGSSDLETSQATSASFASRSQEK